VVCASALALTGCTWTGAGDADRDGLSGVIDSTPTPEPTIGFIPDGTAASGTFTSPDGSTSGSFAVEVSAGEGRVVLEDISSTHPQLAVQLSFAPRGDDPCVDSGAYAFPAFDATATPDPILLPIEGGDWSFLDEIDLTVSSESGLDDAGCAYRIVAQAPLEWTFPPLRPDLATLDDAGAAPGATGTVDTDADGRALTYVAAADDTPRAVAERFGISVEDLSYLNPVAVPSVSDEALSAGQRINLDLDAR
jgi:hypothetical protein